MENTEALEGNSDALRTGKETLKRNAETAAKSKLVADMVKTFGDLKYWLTDWAVSWRNESEENAETAGESLQGLLAKVGKFAPEKTKAIQGHIELISEKSLEAFDTYVDGNRVKGKQSGEVLKAAGKLTKLSNTLRDDVDSYLADIQAA